MIAKQKCIEIFDSISAKVGYNTWLVIGGYSYYFTFNSI